MGTKAVSMSGFFLFSEHRERHANRLITEPFHAAHISNARRAFPSKANPLTNDPIIEDSSDDCRPSNAF